PHFFAFDWRSAFARAFLRNWFMGAVNCVHRRSVFDRVGMWNEKLFRFGDREFYNRVRLSGLPTAYVDEVTGLRFYAQHWGDRFARAQEPPQCRYLEHVSDAQWRDGIRRRTASGPRSLAVRRHQCADFVRFAFASGPKFLRFWYEKLRSGPL